PQNENNTESNPDSEKIIEENNQDSTTETGGFEIRSLVVYAILGILIVAIIGIGIMSIRRP
ncbi:MAG: hypothetical protein CMO20_02705, partial [Thermoplasmata archaeon]|nr:hypothetical protein [Thermoplasmata archaeon]